MQAQTMPRVDVGAVAGHMLAYAADALAETVVLTIDHAEEDGRPLNQLQKMLLVKTALRATNDLEAKITGRLVETLALDGVEAWGLDTRGG